MHPSVERALRVHLEPWKYIAEDDVHRALTNDPCAYLASLRMSLSRISTEFATVERPRKETVKDPGGRGDFRTMPCVVRDQDGTITKTVKVIGTNRVGVKVPDQITVGKLLCLDPAENFVTHVIEACLFSSARTGAVAALATEFLGGPMHNISIRGAGRVGFYAAYYLATYSQVESLTISDLDHNRSENICRALQDGMGVRATATEQVSPDADVVVLATTSAEPILHPTDTTAPVVISLGADSQDQRELADEWAAEAELFVDTEDSAGYGDLWHWFLTGQVRGTDTYPELVDLVPQQRRMFESDQRKVFISTGSALYDNLTAAYLLKVLPD